MRRLVLVGSIVAVTAGALLVACDLFHSTSFRTLCDVDPTSPKCTDATAPPDAASTPTDFCTWEPAAPRVNAQHACAWLGACELPLGNNAFGACMIAALQAYDCTANPDMQVLATSPLHAYWDALWQATSCADVDRAVFPGAGSADKIPECASGGGFVRCGVAYDGGDNSNVRVECDDAGTRTHGENCLAQGKVCDSTSSYECLGADKNQCTVTACTGNQLDDCTDAGVDIGRTCAFAGSGICIQTDAGPACGSTDPTTCPPSSMVTCDDAGTATGCASGFVETLDCTTLTGPGSCNPGPASPPWDLSSACAANGGACAPDTCTGTNNDTLTSCSRGSTVSISCNSNNLGPCHTVRTFDGQRAACTPH